MTHHSSVDVSPGQPTEADLPLSERPLVALDQNTVISPDPDALPVAVPETPLSATAQEIRDRLFALPDVGDRSELGVRMGTLEVESRIGSGGMGAVFKAVDLELSRTVALKVLHPTIAADPALVARFRNEARACATLAHDNIARVFFAGEQDGVHYIVYEFAEGVTLKQLVEDRGKLSSELTVNFAIQATLALNHMNSCGIIHRDIKPSNIILTDSGRIKVVDLGLARRDSTDSIGDLTVAGTILGTFDYIAPEQARDPRVADIRSDIYSLGCTLYHMLTGQPPYPDGTAFQKVMDHQGKAPPDPRFISKSVPAEIAAILRKMMDTDPDQRYQDPGQLLTDLMDIASMMGLRSIPAEGIVWRRVPITRVRELSGSLFLTGAVIAICLTALTMHLWPSGNEANEEAVTKIVEDLLGSRTEQQVPRDTSAVDTALAPEAVSGNNQQTQAPSSESSQSMSNGEATGSGNTMDRSVSPTPVAASILPFVVYHLDGTQSSFHTLENAWGGSRNGDVIELNFDRPLTVPTYRLGALKSRESQQITIQAAPGRTPLVVFEGDDRTIRPESPGQLFDLISNLRLVLNGIDFQINVKEDVQDEQWVLFECNGSNRVDMQDCTITVENRSGRDISVFRFNDQTSNAYAAQRTAISLKNVTIRGSCDLVLLDDQAGGSVSADNCGFAVGGSLINSRGSKAEVPQGDLTLKLLHTTSITRDAAIRMRDSEFLDGEEDPRTLPRVDVISDACVYSSMIPDGTLVRMQGNAYREVLQDYLTWNGTHNLYHNFADFWVVESGALDGDGSPYSFTEWVETWKRTSVGSELDADLVLDDVWANRDPSQTQASLNTFPKSAFALHRRFFYDSEDGMPARHSLDSHGQIIGADVPRLSTFPTYRQAPVYRLAPEDSSTAGDTPDSTERSFDEAEQGPEN